MSKTLILHTSLVQSYQYVEPMVNKLNTFLSKKDEVDVVYYKDLDIDIVKDYDNIILAFMNIAGTIPSSTLQLFDELSKTTHPVQTVYTFICNDEQEIEQCDYSEGIVELFCERNGYCYMGSLKIGSCLIINHLQYGLVLTSYIKKFASAIISNKEAEYNYTYKTKKTFIKDGNKYMEKASMEEE